MVEHYKPHKYKAGEMSLPERFAEYFSRLSEREAVAEANRCLYCYDAPCVVACPTHIDIPSFIRKIATGNVKGSARTILESNLLGATCARVCPVQELCEGSCVLARDQKPIMIGRLQRYATDWAWSRGCKYFDPGAPNGLKVAVVGCGPAGLSCAGELAKAGFAVTCFESRSMAGGLDTYGIVVFREPVEVSLAEVKMVEELGVSIRTGVTVGKEIGWDELVDSFDAVFIGVGMAAVPLLSIPGEELDQVVDGLEFIEQTKIKALDSITVGQRVCVVGAGNTAIDCATIARRLGAERVAIVYRRSEAEMPCYHFEYQFALSEGVSFMFLTQPVAVLGTGCVEALKCIRMDLGPPDSLGRRSPVVVPDSEFVLPADMVIRAIGQKKRYDALEQLALLGVKSNNGYITVALESRQTDNPKVFAGGDCIRSTGEASTVAAVQDGKIAARSICAQLSERARLKHVSADHSRRSSQEST